MYSKTRSFLSSVVSILLTLSIILAFLPSVGGMSASAAYTAIQAGPYYLKNASTGKYLSVDSAKAANGQNLSISAKQSAKAYQFQISGSQSNGYYMASALDTSYMVNPYSDTPANGVNVTLYKKSTDGTQLWHFEAVTGGYIIRNNYNTKLVLAVSGTNVLIQTYSGASSQIWALESTSGNSYSTIEAGSYYFKNSSTGMYLSVDSAKAANGQNLSVKARQATNAFQFQVSGSAASGYYIASLINTGYMVNPYADDPKNGTNVTLYKKSSDGTQLWYFEAVSGGYVIRNHYNSQLVLNVSGSNVQISSYSGAAAQIWSLETTAGQTKYETIKTDQYYLRHASTGKYLSVDGAKAQNGQNLSVTDRQETDAYRFSVSGDATNGYYLGSLLNTGFVANPYSDTPTDGTNITLYKKVTDGTQSWYFEKTDTGYRLHSHYNTDLVLTASDGNALLAKSKNAASEIWELISVSEAETHPTEPEPDRISYTSLADEVYFIKNADSGRYLLAGEDGSIALEEKTITAGAAFYPDGNASSGYLLRTLLDDTLVLAPNDGSIMLTKYNGNTTQNWGFQKFGSSYCIRSRSAEEQVLTDDDGVTLAAFSDQDDQLWILEVFTEEEQLALADSEGTEEITKEDEFSYISDFEWNADNWSFSNISANFTSGYEVSLDIQKRLFTTVSLTFSDKKNMKGWMKQSWSGSCYGFTMSELLALHGDLDIQEFGGAQTLAESECTPEITSLINFYQLSQNCSAILQYYRAQAFTADADSDAAKLRAVLEHFRNGGESFNMCYYYALVDADGVVRGYRGHSVLCYGVESCKDLGDGNGYHSDITERSYPCRLLIADPSFLAENALYDDACLYFDPTDGSWIIPYWNGKQLSFEQKLCTRYCYWNANAKTVCGKLDGQYTYDNQPLYSDLETDHYLAGISLNSTSSDAYVVDSVNGSGNAMFNAADDVLVAPVTHFHEGETGADDGTKDYALWNPTTVYNLTYEKPSDYSLRMDYENVSYFIDAKNVTYTEFDPDGSVLVKGQDAAYEIALVTEERKRVTDWYSMTVSGEGVSDLHMELYENGYLLTGNTLQDVSLLAENDTVTAQAEFSTEQSAVYIYEIDEVTIGVAVDLDEDGTFETVIVPERPTEPDQTVMLGDVNDDSEIDISDVIAINKALLGSAEMTEHMLISGDVDKNGELDFTDSLNILKFVVKLISSFEG